MWIGTNDANINNLVVSKDTTRRLKIYKGCGSFAFEARALFFNRIAAMRSVRAVRMRGDIDTSTGYLVGVR